MKLLEENTGVHLYNLGFAHGFLDITSKAWPTKEIIDKLNYIKILNFLCKEHYKGSEKTYKMGENFSNNIFDEGLISRIYKKLWQLNNNKTNMMRKRTKVRKSPIN